MMRRFVCVLLGIVFVFSTAAVAADLQALLRETQKIRQSGQTFDLVWWIPTEYWNSFLDNNPGITKEQKDAFIKVLDPYVVISVVRMNFGVFGGTTIAPSEEVMKNIQLRTAGRILSPLKPDELSPDASNFFLMMKPMMERSLGTVGKGMEFVVFSNRDEKGKIVDPMSPGWLECVFFGTVYRWRLPLGSLLPPMADPTTGEVFPGNYQFNPFTGDKLVRAPEKNKKDEEQKTVKKKGPAEGAEEKAPYDDQDH